MYLRILGHFLPPVKGTQAATLEIPDDVLSPQLRNVESGSNSSAEHYSLEVIVHLSVLISR